METSVRKRRRLQWFGYRLPPGSLATLVSGIRSQERQKRWLESIKEDVTSKRKQW